VERERREWEGSTRLASPQRPWARVEQDPGSAARTRAQVGTPLPLSPPAVQSDRSEALGRPALRRRRHQSALVTDRAWPAALAAWAAGHEARQAPAVGPE